MALPHLSPVSRAGIRELPSSFKVSFSIMQHGFLIILSLTLLLLSACSAKPRVEQPHRLDSSDYSITRDTIAAMLHSQYTSWQGTPYRQGGLSRKGIDCSGLVQRVYADLFSLQLPRTVKEQRKQGKRINIRHLLPGDLLFFDTGWFSDHVGIYMGNGSFLHASASTGVRISYLGEPYWRQRFEMAKRLKIFQDASSLLLNHLRLRPL